MGCESQVASGKPTMAGNFQVFMENIYTLIIYIYILIYIVETSEQPLHATNQLALFLEPLQRSNMGENSNTKTTIVHQHPPCSVITAQEVKLQIKGYALV